VACSATLITAIGSAITHMNSNESVKLKFCRGLLAEFLIGQCRIHAADTKSVPLNHIGVVMVTPLECALSWIQFPVESNLLP